MTYSTRRYRSVLSTLVQRGTLAAFVAIMSVSCASSTDSVSSSVSPEKENTEFSADAGRAEAERTEAERTEKEANNATETDYYSNDAQAEARTRRVEMIRDDSDDDAPRSLADTTEGLEAGMIYSEARALLINRGWLPHTQSTLGPEYKWNNPDVEKMQARQFSEIYDCVDGTCEAQFVYEDRLMEDGSILTVSAELTSDAAIPSVTSWAIEDSANKTYAQRSFDAALFEQLRAEQSFCVSAAQCGLDRYILSDALILSGTYGFGSTKVALIPQSPVSQATALDYAKALDAKGVIDFESKSFYAESNADVYREAGLPSENVAETRGSVTQVKLFQTSDGTVSEIVFETIVL